MTDLTGVERLIHRQEGHIPRLLFVFTGPSGAGKNAIIKRLLDNYPDYMARVRTYTTRDRRQGEVEGQQYYFVSRERFAEMADEGLLMEGDGVDVYGVGNVYSMPADPFQDLPPDKHLVIAEVDVHGQRRLKERFSNLVTIFIAAPAEKLVKRIRKRDEDGHMEDDELEQRMQTARDQMEAANEFDYIVFNEGDLDETVAAVDAIITAERMRLRSGVGLGDLVTQHQALSE